MRKRVVRVSVWGSPQPGPQLKSKVAGDVVETGLGACLGFEGRIEVLRKNI